MGTSKTNQVPTKISNNRFIQQMELWGWTKRRNQGDRWLMERKSHPGTPNIAVMAPNVHKGNNTLVIREVYDWTTEGDANVFWARKAPANVPVVPATVETIDKYKQRMDDGERYCQSCGETYNVAEIGENDGFCIKCDPTRIVDPAGPFTDIDDDRETPGQGVADVVDSEKGPGAPPDVPAIESPAKAVRGASKDVLVYLHQHPFETVTAATVAKATGVSVKTTQNALSYLASIGLAERVLRGAYRLDPLLAADKVVHHEHTGPVEVTYAPAPAPEAPPAPVLPKVFIYGDPAPVITAPEPDSGDDLDALLELILPADYRFHPSHIKHMRRWQTQTAELLAALRSRPA